MPMNLADLMGIAKPPGGGMTGPGAPAPGSMPGPPPGGGAAGGGGQPGIGGQVSNLMQTMPANGIRSITSSMMAMVIKILQAVGVAYDIDSAEGKSINTAIKSLMKVSKGQQTGNMQSIVQSLISSLPPGYQNIKPGDLMQGVNDLLAKRGSAGPGGPGMPPPSGGAPGGAMPPSPGPMASLMS